MRLESSRGGSWWGGDHGRKKMRPTWKMNGLRAVSMYTAARRSRSPPSPPWSGEIEKSLAEKESVPEHVAEWGQCDAGRNARSYHRRRKASGRRDDVAGRCADGAFPGQCMDEPAGENKEGEEKEL